MVIEEKKHAVEEFLRKSLRKESNKELAERGRFEPPVPVLASTTV
jgi:hypothetical protein